jgi:hypothetical protein
MKRERILRAQDLTEDSELGDSGIILDDSDLDPRGGSQKPNVTSQESNSGLPPVGARAL